MDPKRNAAGPCALVCREPGSPGSQGRTLSRLSVSGSTWVDGRGRLGKRTHSEKFWEPGNFPVWMVTCPLAPHLPQSLGLPRERQAR